MVTWDVHFKIKDYWLYMLCVSHQAVKQKQEDNWGTDLGLWDAQATVEEKWKAQGPIQTTQEG